MDSTRSLQALTPADFPIVADLGRRIWHQHYASIVSQAQIEFMLELRNSPRNLAEYLGSDQRWMHVLRLGETPVGYCSHALGARDGEMKLEQLYLLPNHQGQGLGVWMMAFIEAHARALGSHTLVLQVNKANASSFALYQRKGFTVRSETVFQIGRGFVMDDYVMEKRLGPMAGPSGA